MFFPEWRSCFNFKIEKSETEAGGWLSFVVTSKAKTKIKQLLNEERTKAAAEGKEMLMGSWELEEWLLVMRSIQRLIVRYNC